MGRYRIRVATGAWLFSGSHNRVQLWLVGVRGESELELQLRPARGQVSRGSWDSDPGLGPGRARGGRRQLWLRLSGLGSGVWGSSWRLSWPGRGSEAGPLLGSTPFYLPATIVLSSLHFFPN